MRGLLELLKLRLLKLDPEVVLAMSFATDFEPVVLYLGRCLRSKRLSKGGLLA